MRVGSVILIHNSMCIQSYNWSVFRSLGSLQSVIDSLEEYQCDEISIIRPVKKDDTTDSFIKDLKVIESIKCMTPISFGGGIRSLEHLSLLHDLPIERLIFSSAFIKKDAKLINEAKKIFGHQAIQCLLPLCIREEELFVYNSSVSEYVSFKNIDFDFIDLLANEIIIVDVEREGESDSFNWDLITKLPFSYEKIIVSGGVGARTIGDAYGFNIASVLIDNKVLHSEYSISGYKNA